MPGRFGFVDRVLPDGAVERAYDNGRVERRIWNAQVPDVVAWSDNTGNEGRDRDLGRGRIERTDAHGVVMLGQQVGHGVTSWNDGQYVTVNETPLPEPPPPPPIRPGGLAGVLIALGIGGLFGLGGAALLSRGDEAMLYDEIAMEEEAMRRTARQQQTSQSSSSSDGGGDGGWDDDDGDGGGDGVDSFG